MPKIRALFALEINNNQILDNIEKYQRELQKSIGPLKIVHRSLIHVTLRFLGNINIDTAKELYRFMDSEINNKFFDQENKIGILKGVGDFNKRVFFIKIHGVNDFLREIYEKINDKTKAFPEIKQESKPYSPHLTIARSKRKSYSHSQQKRINNPGQIGYAQLKSKFKDYEFGKWKIKKVVLKKSLLTPTGPIYSNLEF